MAAINIAQFMSYIGLLAQLVEAGKTTVTKIRGFLQQEGATPEQLAALDAALTSAIDQREREHGPTP